MRRVAGLARTGRAAFPWAAALAAAAGLALFPLSSAAAEGVAFGLHGGYSDPSGNIFRGSGDLSGTPFLGLHVVFPVAPILSLAVLGEARTQDLSFEDAGVDGVDGLFRGSAEWTDQALYVSARLRVVPFGVGPAGIHIGGGAGVHLQQLELKGVVPALRAAPPGRALPVEPQGTPGDFIGALEEERTEVSYHAIAGLSVGMGPLPVTVFGEARFEEIDGRYSPRSYSAYAGVSIEL